VALSRGWKAKWVAQCCGTSLEMVDRHYGRWMGDDAGQLALLTEEPTSSASTRRVGER
jgi:hypothetical protein